MSSFSKNKKKRKMVPLTKDEELELERLEKFLFGKGQSVLENADEQVSSRKEDTVKNNRKPKRRELKPAWEDTDDSGLKVEEALTAQGRPKMGVPGKPNDDYQSVLKRRFETRVGNPDWARLDKKVESDEETDILKRCGNFINTKIVTLPRGVLDIKKVHVLNKVTAREGPYINSVQFHPTSTVALVAGTAGMASLYQVDGTSNSHLQSVRFERFPIRCARFSLDGNQFIVGSQHHSHYFVYDMVEGRVIRVTTHHATEQTNMKKFEMSPDGKLIAVCGRFGDIHLLDARTREWVGKLQMSGEVTALCFNPSGSKLWSHGDRGEVYIWDVSSRKCEHRFIDDGCLQGSSIAVSPSGQLLACGSKSGVVNVYQTQTVLKSRTPQPTKALMHLVTAATSVEFNSTSQILAMASDDKDSSLKLVHFPSTTVFSNFPTQDSLLGRVQSFHFSPGSGFLAVGNNQHTVPLFRLNYFGNY